MKTVDYLDAVKRRLGLPSDYALQKPLGVSKQAISSYRTGHSTFDHIVAGRIAELLDVDPIRVIADVEIERATKPEQRKLWERIAAKVAAGVLVAVGAQLAAPAPAQASPNGGAAVYYVKSDRRRRRAWWFPLLPPIEPPDGLA